MFAALKTICLFIPLLHGRPAGTLVVIGISGRTKSGQSQLAKNLRSMDCLNEPKYVIQDNRFVNEEWVRLRRESESEEGCLEDARAIDHDKFFRHVKMIIERVKKLNPGGDNFIILEGFQLFHDMRIRQLVTHPIWLTTAREHESSSTIPREEFARLCFPENDFYGRTYRLPCYLVYRRLMFDEKENAEWLKRTCFLDRLKDDSLQLKWAMEFIFCSQQERQSRLRGRYLGW